VAQIYQQQQSALQSQDSNLGATDSLPPPPGAGASLAVGWAHRELGKPYVYGAAGPDSFDCSGLTMYVWAKAGAGLPHSAAGQWDDTVRVPMGAIQPGDLVFFYQPVDHVGIYVGGGEMIVAPHTGTDVKYESIYEPGLDGAGRVG
jgi:peptidoglycan DL-endopeptidase CwlO